MSVNRSVTEAAAAEGVAGRHLHAGDITQLTGSKAKATAEVLYPGSLFFETPNLGDSEILDHDILDTAGEIQALIDLLGPGSPPAAARQSFRTP